MGYGGWSDTAYRSVSTSYAKASTADIFTSTASRAPSDGMKVDGLVCRESRDSDEHPNSIPVAIFLDVTGSMGRIPEQLARGKLGTLMDVLLNHKVPDPQMLFCAVGDHYSDRHPIQMGQFESETTLVNKWLTEVYIEGGGGGQHYESYPLAWLVGGRYTSLDSYEKRGQKGFLFTIGDEAPWGKIEGEYIKKLFGAAEASDVTAKQLLDEVSRTYEVFHLHMNSTGYRNAPQVIGPWKNLLGERLLMVDDLNSTAEVIATTVAVSLGANLDTVIKDFDRAIARDVGTALMPYTSNLPSSPVSNTGIIRI